MRQETFPGGVRVLVASEPDAASMNQRAALLGEGGWREATPFEGRPTWSRGDLRLVTITELHLHRDGLDRDLEAALGERPDLVAYLSKHRSESRNPSLTVHPVGNPLGAELGGRPGVLVPAAAAWMTSALRILRQEARDLPYDVTFEATHHGPCLDTPTFYIEQGSTEREWGDPEASRAIARTLLRLEPVDAPVAVGFGGGHYMPRQTDLARAYRIAFGHLIPSHSLAGPTAEIVARAVEATPGATLAYLHRKSLGKPETRTIEELLASRGVRVVREADLVGENKTS